MNRQISHKQLCSVEVYLFLASWALSYTSEAISLTHLINNDFNSKLTFYAMASVNTNTDRFETRICCFKD